jgi:citrate synthase
MPKNEGKPTTAICGYDADNISIRGKDLVSELVGQYSFTEMMLFQALGQEPTTAQVDVLDAVLVTIMEHGLVPSAVVTRLTHYGAPESFQGAIAAGLLGVGDRYAGTAGQCGEMLERIVSVESGKRKAQAIAEVKNLRELGKPVPGFGHPIHQATDPRVDRLLEVARSTGVKGEFIAAGESLESAVREVIGKPLVTNISAGIAMVLGEIGVPAALMRGIVLTARCAGLVGHLFEEMNKPVAHAIWKAAEAEVGYEP